MEDAGAQALAHLGLVGIPRRDDDVDVVGRALRASRGISSGRSWRSASISTVMSPDARWRPARVAGCWPKFRERWIPTTRSLARALRRDDLPRVVGAAVVDEDDLVRAAALLEHGGEPLRRARRAMPRCCTRARRPRRKRTRWSRSHPANAVTTSMTRSTSSGVMSEKSGSRARRPETSTVTGQSASGVELAADPRLVQRQVVEHRRDAVVPCSARGSGRACRCRRAAPGRGDTARRRRRRPRWGAARRPTSPTAGARRRSAPRFLAPGLDDVDELELREHDRGQRVGEEVARAAVDPGVLVDLAEHEAGSVGALLAHDERAVPPVFAVHEQGAALAARDVLGLVEAERGEVAVACPAGGRTTTRTARARSPRSGSARARRRAGGSGPCRS